jgi:hypothetical protein
MIFGSAGGTSNSSPALAALLGLGVASEGLYVLIAWLSRSFVYGERFAERPIVPVLLAFAAAFACYLGAVAAAVRVPAGWRLTSAIVGPALLFRATLLFSQPIQEVDIYRYLWDGAVLAEGVSPFRHSPAEVIAAAEGAEMPGDLTRPVALVDQSPVLGEVLRRVHFGDLPTVYPPTSQAVFALAHWITPSQTSLDGRVAIMKGVILVFDVATVFLLLPLLRLGGRHPGWAVVYAWCPLVLKEFANSGHLDSIAVCLTVAGLCGVIEATFGENAPAARKRRAGILGAMLLGLAVGAKLYPIVLWPWFVALFAARRGWRAALALGTIFVATSGLALAPMLADNLLVGSVEPAMVDVAALPLVPGGSLNSHLSQDSLAGLRAFLGRWEMNDFLFLLTVENIRPMDASAPTPSVWFSVAPDAWRNVAVDACMEWASVDSAQASFCLARGLTTAVFLALVGLFAWQAMKSGEPSAALRAAFLTLAWFWLLSPTQNPWYWTWAVPLAPFARGRAWLAVSGLTLLYYLRFWLVYQWTGSPIWGSAYDGPAFFDFVVTWIEFGPWFLLLFVEWLLRQRQHRRPVDAAASLNASSASQSLAKT